MCSYFFLTSFSRDLFSFLISCFFQDFFSVFAALLYFVHGHNHCKCFSQWTWKQTRILGVKCPYPPLGDHRLVPRAGQQWIPAGLQRRCQGEGKGGDDHLLSHQRSPRQLTTDPPPAEWLPLHWQDGETELTARRWATKALGGVDGRQGRAGPVR